MQITITQTIPMVMKPVVPFMKHLKHVNATIKQEQQQSDQGYMFIPALCEC